MNLDGWLLLGGRAADWQYVRDRTEWLGVLKEADERMAIEDEDRLALLSWQPGDNVTNDELEAESQAWRMAADEDFERQVDVCLEERYRCYENSDWSGMGIDEGLGENSTRSTEEWEVRQATLMASIHWDDEREEAWKAYHGMMQDDYIEDEDRMGTLIQVRVDQDGGELMMVDSLSEEALRDTERLEISQLEADNSFDDYYDLEYYSRYQDR